MVSNDDAHGGDISAQLAKLRAQVEQVANERIRPAVSDAAGRANAMAKEQSEALAGHVRDQPLLAIGIAAGLGFLIGRAMR